VRYTEKGKEMRRQSSYRTVTTKKKKKKKKKEKKKLSRVRYTKKGKEKKRQTSYSTVTTKKKKKKTALCYEREKDKRSKTIYNKDEEKREIKGKNKLKPLSPSFSLLFLYCLRILLLGLLLSLGCSLLSLDATHAAVDERAVEGVVDMALAVTTDKEGRNIHELLAYTDVTLEDQHTSVVDGTSKLGLEHDGLETTLKEVLVLKSKNVIELVLVLRENAHLVKTTKHCTTLEHTTLVVLLKSQKETGTLAELGESVVHTIHLTLAAKTIDTAETKLRVETLLLERTTRGAVHA